MAGLLRLDSQFLTVLALTPNLFAISFCVEPAANRFSNSNLHNGVCWLTKGGESSLVAVIKRWQKGFRNHPFRQLKQALMVAQDWVMNSVIHEEIDRILSCEGVRARWPSNRINHRLDSRRLRQAFLPQ